MSKTGAKKRKKSKSPDSSKENEEKKVKSDPTKKCDENPSSQSSQPTISTVKPIIASTNIQEVKGIISHAKLSKVLCKIKGSSCTQISCCNINDKRVIINELKSKKIGFHTYSEKSEKSNIYILKGFYNTSKEDLMKILKKENVPALKVSDFIRKEEYVMYLVHFDNSINIETLTRLHRTLDGIVVRWEMLKKTKRNVTQCYKCQAWGHASFSCGYQDRCVKCSDSHPKGQCPRSVRDDKVICCNCGGNHSANHRGCPAYKKYIDIISSHMKKAKEIKNPTGFSSSEFPQLPKIKRNPAQPASSRTANNKLASSQLTNHISYAEKLQEAVKTDNLYKKLNEAQEKLRKIQDIEKTIDDFCKFVDELSEVPNNNSARFSVLLKYNVAITESDEESSQDDGMKKDEYEIQRYDDDTYVKRKIIDGEEWMNVGPIVNLNEYDKAKMKT